MSGRALAVLAGASVLLAGAALLMRSRSAPDVPQALAPPDLAAKAARLTVKGPEGSFTFAKSSRTWRMESPVAYPADSQALDGALERLGKASLTDPLTEDAAGYSLYGLSSASATRVQVWVAGATGPLLDLDVGKEGADYDTSYVRLAGRPAVHQAQGLSASVLVRGAGEWLDKTVAALPRDSVEKLVVRSSSGTLKFERAAGVWRAGGAALSTATARELVEPGVEALSPLEAWRAVFAGDLPEKARRAMARPELVIEAAGGGAAVSLRVGGKDDAGYRYVQKEGVDPVWFLVSDWKLDAFRKKELWKLRSRG